MKSLEELSKALKQREQQLEEERQAALAVYLSEQAEHEAVIKAEQTAQEAKNKAAEEKWLKAKLEKEARAEQHKQAEREARITLERTQNEIGEKLRLQKEEAARLDREIENAKFLEEQARKLVEDSVVVPEFFARRHLSINVEHPEAPVSVAEPGGAVEGTTGETLNDPEMSSHLKHILRQAERTY